MNKQRQKDTLIDIMNEDAKDGLYDHSVDSNKMMSAVEWLSQKYNYVTWLRNRDEISPIVADNLRERYLTQAKQMERKQIIEAYSNGSNDRLKNRINGQYYNETYDRTTNPNQDH